MTKQIPLTQGKFALVDDEDYGWLMQWKWRYTKRGYAVRNSTYIKGTKRQLVYMHREILKPPDGYYTDHINGNKLDNRKLNLRNCTTAENQHNQSLRKDNTSGRKGVILEKSTQKWRARIVVSGKRIHLGLFSDLEDAARAYDKAAIENYGEFARLNFPSNS